MKSKTMKDIPTGTILETANGKRYLYLGQMPNEVKKSTYIKDDEVFYGISDSAFMTWDNEFNSIPENSNFKITRIYFASPRCGASSILSDGNNLGDIWNSTPVKEMSISEIEQVLGYRIKIKEN